MSGEKSDLRIDKQQKSTLVDIFFPPTKMHIL